MQPNVASVDSAASGGVPGVAGGRPPDTATARFRTRGCDPRDTSPEPGSRVDDVVAKLGDIAAGAGLRRIAILAWRDLDDPEAGGSECTRRTIASLWGEAGIEVTMRTSYAPGRPQVSWRDGYRVIRKAGRYMVFPRAAFSEMMGWHGASDGLVEIWNGMPFFSPVWARRPTRHVAAPRARHDVGDDAAAAARAARAHDRVPRRAAALPAHADRHALGVVEARARRAARLHARATCTSCRRASTRGSRRAARSRRRRSSSRSAGSCPVKRFHLLHRRARRVSSRATRSCAR